jgi:hypothetical protein
MSFQQTPVEQAIESLDSSPLFNLSLASKELFHSNILAWLCEQYPNEVGGIFAKFLQRPQDSYSPLKVYREKNHIDLWIKYPGGEELLIENKVKSIPSMSQLTEYSALKGDLSQRSFLLLSLVHPQFLLPGERIIQLENGVHWHYLNYGELVAELNRVLPQIEIANQYYGMLLRDYINFVLNLHVIQYCLAIDWEHEESDFFFDKDDMRLLRKIRIHDVFDKLRYAQLVQHLEWQLHKEGFNVTYGKVSQQQVLNATQAGQILLDYGMTRNTGLADLKYILFSSERFGTPVILGIQLQGNDFRLVVEACDETIAQKIADALWQPRLGKRIWFDLGRVPSDSDERPAKDKPFNQFSGKFFYRSKRLGAISPQHLTKTIVAYVRLIHDNEAALRQQVEDTMLLESRTGVCV